MTDTVLENFMTKHHSIQNLIQQQTTELLPNLSQKIAQLQRLNELWQKYIEMKLAKHSRVANWREGRLVIEVDSANWATHLRYSLPELLIKLKTEKELAELKYIEWYIRPVETAAIKKQARKPAPISLENSQLITDAATHIEHDKLKQVLLALAKRTQNN
jgi:hypothetical protein